MREAQLLSDCLVDSDPETLRRGKQRRRKALAISLVVEAAILAALLLTPILMPPTISARYLFVPLPPFGGGHPAPHSGPSTPHPSEPQRPGGFWIPRSIPPHIDTSPDQNAADDAAPSIGPGGDCNTCAPGLGIPGGNERDGFFPAPAEPPAPPPASKPLSVSMGAQEAKLIRRVEPVYPPLAIQIHLSGTVELRAIIAKDGTVINLEVVSGNPLLVQSAVAAVRQWRYRPTLLSGQPVEVQTFVTVKFELTR